MTRTMIAAAALLSATGAAAAPVVYTDEGRFDAATAGATLATEGFEGTPAGSGNTLVFDTLSFTCRNCAAAVSSRYPTQGVQSLGVNTGVTEPLQFTLFRAANALSFDLSDFGTLAAADLSLTVNGQTVSLLDGFRGATGNRLFFGFTDTASFTSFTLTGGNSGDVAYFDRLRFGTLVDAPPGGAVPEPASWAMMIGGFGLVGAAARRRSATLAFA
jgi:hypothetical protein